MFWQHQTRVTQGLLLVLYSEITPSRLRGSYVVQGIESRLVAYKTRTLPAVLSHQYLHFKNKSNITPYKSFYPLRTMNSPPPNTINLQYKKCIHSTRHLPTYYFVLFYFFWGICRLSLALELENTMHQSTSK